MASVRKLKKTLNDMVLDVVEEAYSIQLYDEKKKKKTDELIDEAASFLEDTLTKVNAAETKKAYKKVEEEIDKKTEDLIEKLNKLQA